MLCLLKQVFDHQSNHLERFKLLFRKITDLVQEIGVFDSCRKTFTREKTVKVNFASLGLIVWIVLFENLIIVCYQLLLSFHCVERLPEIHKHVLDKDVVVVIHLVKLCEDLLDWCNFGAGLLNLTEVGDL